MLIHTYQSLITNFFSKQKEKNLIFSNRYKTLEMKSLLLMKMKKKLKMKKIFLIKFIQYLIREIEEKR